MGIKNLSHFIHEYKFLTDSSFKESKLIIDGSNLYNRVYHSSKEVKFGGNYYAYDMVVSKFFKALKDCAIEPYVVLDGTYDHMDLKEETLKQRSEDRIRKINEMCLNPTSGTGSLKPPLLKPVFIETLTRLNIPFIQCMEEADWQIAALANEWNCPVLSDDSDFFIFGLSAGVLPLKDFKWKQSSRCIPSKKFFVSKLCEHYGLNRQLLPLFAALAGNDYVNLKEVSLSFETASSLQGPNAHMDGILRMLSRYQNTDDAIKALKLNDEDNASVQKALEICQTIYQLKQPNDGAYLARFFMDNVDPTPPEILRVLPVWIQARLFRGKMSPMIIKTLLKRVQLGPQVENFDLPSSNTVSRPIRQVLYGLLLSIQQPHAAPGECHVEEYDREGSTLGKFTVTAINPSPGLDLRTLNTAPQELRENILTGTLGVSRANFSPCAVNFQLPVFATCYWLREANPQPSIEHMWALLIGFVFGEVSEQYTGQRGIREVWRKLNQLRRDCEESNLNLQTAHTFSQWQSCLRDTYKLNQLLCLPLPEPELRRLYCGPMLHQAALRLMAGDTPEPFVSDGPITTDLFRDLQQAVLDSLDGETKIWVQNAIEVRRRGAQP